MTESEVRAAVRQRYGAIATADEAKASSCCGTQSSCCGPAAADEPGAAYCSGSSSSCCGSMAADDIAGAIGYSEEERGAVPQGANLGLGCGNPVALAALEPGQTVLDLGSGAGFDCFLAARRVGPEGQVIGVDMTPSMVDKARSNAAGSEYGNVEFRLGEIEHLPVADASVDAIISNCVINLSPDKGQVFAEAMRVLRPGGRLMVSDLVLDAPLPEAVRDSVEAYVGCVAGAMLRRDYLEAMRAAGFEQVEVVEESGFAMDCVTAGPQECGGSAPLSEDDVKCAAAAVRSARVRAAKPG